MKVGDLVVRIKATSSSLLPKGTQGEVVAVTDLILILKEHPWVALATEDFRKS